MREAQLRRIVTYLERTYHVSREVAWCEVLKCSPHTRKGILKRVLDQPQYRGSRTRQAVRMFCYHGAYGQDSGKAN